VTPVKTHAEPKAISDRNNNRTQQTHVKANKLTAYVNRDMIYTETATKAALVGLA